MVRKVILLLFLAAVFASPAAPAAATAPCAGGDLTGTFHAIPALMGEEYYTYKLRLTNVSGHSCFVTGIPGLKLLDVRRKPLPTRPTVAHPGQLSAIQVTLPHGGHASLTARLSPVLYDSTEPYDEDCERTAFWLKVSPTGGGSFTAPIFPTTPVCGHGAMRLTVFVPSH
jgi:hypothetical protein